MPACAFYGSLSSHGSGGILAATSNVKVNTLNIAVIGDDANPDDLCPGAGGDHCNPKPSTGSSTVFAGGIAVHRVGDLRLCGGSTTTGSVNVFVGG